MNNWIVIAILALNACQHISSPSAPNTQQTQQDSVWIVYIEPAQKSTIATQMQQHPDIQVIYDYQIISAIAVRLPNQAEKSFLDQWQNRPEILSIQKSETLTLH